MQNIDMILNISDYNNNDTNSIKDERNLIEDTYFKTALSVILTVSFILSLVGNLCTCAVIIRYRYMRTPTNCYLFNLAITDLMTALFIPVEIYIIWIPDYYPIGEVGCRIHFFLWECLSNCSVLTIFAFTIERYIVITKPFLRQSLLLTSRVIKITLVNWMLSGLFSIPEILYVTLLERKKDVYCYFKTTENMLSFEIVGLFIFFIFPMSAIFILYILIAIKLKYAHIKLKNSLGYVKRNRDKAITMLAAVAASFFFCWSPYFFLRLMMITPQLRQKGYYNVWQVFVYMTLINSYLSTGVNPILYSLMSRKFWQAFKDLLRGRKSSTPKGLYQNSQMHKTGKTIALINMKRQRYSIDI